MTHAGNNSRPAASMLVKRSRIRSRCVQNRQASGSLCCLAIAVACLVPSIGFSQESATGPPDTAGAIEVIRVTPLGGIGVDRRKVPASIQSASSEELAEQHRLDLTEFMRTNFASVFVNEAQNNPLQPDLQFRGFVASPLLGLPQGLAVYQDGVRINEPFGDTVNWALIPESAIATMDLVSGSHPLFGLNSLGGAVSLQTKNGFTDPGTRGEVLAGSFERIVAKAETGGVFGSSDNLSYYVNVWHFEEDGWRDYSPSEASRVFAKVGWQGEKSNLDVAMSYADTELIGNGPVPVQLQALDREAVFTRPDITENELAMLSLRAHHSPRSALSIDWNVYVRLSDIDTFNGDDSDFEECEEPENEGLICLESNEEEEEDGEEEPSLDQNGNSIVATESVEGATINRSATEQDGLGASLQLTFEHELTPRRRNQFVAGVSFDHGDVDFRSSTELGMLDTTRLAIPGGAFVGDAFTELKTTTNSYGVFFNNTLEISPDLALTFAGRYNRTEIELRDQLGTALDGDHSFDRFNPSLGVTYQFSRPVQFYAGYFESSRTPSPVELTCADEDDPCRLPNAFLADPPLKQVVARTWETGLRGRSPAIRWFATLFSTRNEDDILFVSAGPLTNQGFFDNVGETSRQGIELSAQGELGEKLSWFANYTFLEAEFREDFVVSSANHPLAEDNEIMVNSGDRLPGTPENLAKAGIVFDITPKFTLATNAVYSSDRVLRADEGNLLPTVPGYVVFYARGEYRFNDHVSIFAKIDNLFDKEYETFGLLGDAAEVLGKSFDDRQFLAPGSPRAVYVGLQLAL